LIHFSTETIQARKNNSGISKILKRKKPLKTCQLKILYRVIIHFRKKGKKKKEGNDFSNKSWENSPLADLHKSYFLDRKNIIPGRNLDLDMRMKSAEMVQMWETKTSYF
jgi:hypothetical protein